MKVIGIIPTKFTAKDTGEVITGVNIHGTYPASCGGGNLGTDKFYLSDRKLAALCPDLKIGDEIEPIRNREGKVTRIVRLAK